MKDDMAFGKHFASMYEGSMRGSGAVCFALWGYVISHMKPRARGDDLFVELNPEIVAFLIGENQKEIERWLHKFTQPDKNSRSQIEGGRKLVQESRYSYRVVNGRYYRELERAEERRDYKRNWYRQHKPTAREQINHNVNNDPITKSDAAAVRKLTNTPSVPVPTSSLPGDAAYDLTDVGDGQP